MENVIPLTKLSLDDLAAALLEAKKVEAEARDMRIAIEQQIIETVGVKDEGAFTVKSDRFKVTTTGKLTRKVDWKKYHAVCEVRIPEALRPVRIKEELDTKLIKHLESNEPELFAVMAECLTTSPAKPAVSVTPLED